MSPPAADGRRRRFEAGERAIIRDVTTEVHLGLSRARPPRRATADLSGRILGPYRIVERLGAGGMGQVYRAEDLALGRQVAIKVLSPKVASRGGWQRLLYEARALAAIDHPNVVTLYAVERAAGRRLMVMELVRGRHLGRLIPDGGFDGERFLQLALPLAAALGAAHAAGIVHRDVKPANVMVGDDGRLKLIDFGLAKLGPAVESPDELRSVRYALRRQGHVLGTYPYMSPEQLRGEPTDPRSDVFSLGTVLYEMASGRHPFPGDEQAAVVAAILGHPPRPLAAVKAGLPAGLGRIVGRCLEKEPPARYANAGQVQVALAGLAARRSPAGRRRWLRRSLARGVG
ncbi:MAG: serine/threonine protein kinase [Acidobacteria bacterium]|nr:MAG: serine/threonine protein kinase [Acidobacteriota bacterium]